MRTVKRTWTAMIVLLLTIVLSAGYDAAVQADTLSGLADVTVVDGAILSIRHADAEYIVADGDLVLGTTTRWYINAGVETLWAEGDPAPATTVSGTSNPKAGDVGSNADNFMFAVEGDPDNISSIDGIDFQETIFPFSTNTVFLFERGGNDKGTWQGILEDGSLGTEVAFDKAPYADTGVGVGGQNAFGVVFTTDVPVIGVRITASGHDTLSISIPAPEPILVDPNSDLAAAAAAAQVGDRIIFAEGTYVLTSQLEIKDGVTYRGAGADLTIIDGNNVTRAFVAWGDRGATDGQVDANGVAIPNLTGPKGWVLDGLTIQNCVADAASRQDILSAARDLLNDYTDAPYTLETAQAENGGVTDNPEWFDILSGSADGDLTDAELQAYLDANPPGSAGHLVVNDAMDTGGGALVLRNGAAGAVQNCSFLNNQALLNSGDGGAILTGNTGTALIIDNCEFTGNSCDDGGGALRMNSGSACTIAGTTFTENQAVGDSADGGAIAIANSETTLAIDNCEFNGNSCVDGGGAIRLGGNGSVRTITASTFTGNYITGDGGDGGAIKCDGDDSTYVLTDCSFIGNTAMDDGGAVRYNPNRAELTVTNCAFIGNGKDADGNAVGDDHGAWSTGNDNAGPMTFMNCLFADNASVDDRVVEVRAAFAFLNCTFVGNVAGDEAILAIRGQDWDSTGDGVDDVTTDDSIIANCLFINNTMLSNKQIIGDTRNDVFAPTVTNCLFFGNLDQNSELAQNTDGNSTETGTIDVGAVTDATEIVVDPLGDYHLVAGSPAIDASDPATATEADIEGTAAVGVRDVGAYEFVGL
ncbi:MAG: right-handed parallel beta-helix repeat-containing protein [Sedimentisphaerales bacterium]|nr:right-handed parallel beta-helix repeat-containing protein [Sedimentisphaerales bacterium]